MMLRVRAAMRAAAAELRQCDRRPRRRRSRRRRATPPTPRVLVRFQGSVKWWAVTSSGPQARVGAKFTITNLHDIYSPLPHFNTN